MNSLLAFLRCEGRDGRGRTLPDVLALDDAQLEATHDFIQWLFPLTEASRAVPGSPVLDEREAALIRADPHARVGLQVALARMVRFYAMTDRWLTDFDHNHLRITRIISATRNLLGEARAAKFHAAVTGMNEAHGSPVNEGSLRHWERALH